ncbi:MAG TPA: hypothetical protein VGP47_05690 [Parachlamydiaceae bacterium]|nr:hypothetical protein [Parachlamydiaceae bacterium]
MFCERMGLSNHSLMEVEGLCGMTYLSAKLAVPILKLAVYTLGVGYLLGRIPAAANPKVRNIQRSAIALINTAGKIEAGIGLVTLLFIPTASAFGSLSYYLIKDTLG